MDSLNNGFSPELPKPETSEQFDTQQTPIETEKGSRQEQPKERSLSDAEQAVAVASQPVVTPVSTPTPQTDGSDSSHTMTNPSLADDVDVIEKEWVDKAKSIVAATRHDPFEQSIKLTDMKHDYMKKRYGKEIKRLDESAA
jgi:hypothetical protein